MRSTSEPDCSGVADNERDRHSRFFSQLLCHLSEHVAVEFGILLVVLLDLLLQGLVFQLHIPEFSSNIVTASDLALSFKGI